MRKSERLQSKIYSEKCSDPKTHSNSESVLINEDSRNYEITILLILKLGLEER